jgi:hypothetical protein
MTAATCNVCMADWTEKPIEIISLGDEIVGFNKGLERATVTHVHEKKDMIVKATTDTGRAVYATPEQEFLRAINAPRRRYGNLKVGREIVSVYKPLPAPSVEEQRLLDWLGGMLDGEGSCSSSGTTLYQSTTSNPEMCSVIQERLRLLKIDFEEFFDPREGVIHFKLQGGRSLKARILRHCSIGKKQRVLNAVWGAGRYIAESNGRRGGSSHERVISIEEIGEQTVYDIITTTGNYVCQGFAVHEELSR